ncbi:MAG TPA: SpoIID/LytB domain-containing protein, partial [Gaiellaceae bacterium]|nr:SpoIID/LytB domain-containing protein [Gaiellaceae bacterium]
MPRLLALSSAAASAAALLASALHAGGPAPAGYVAPAGSGALFLVRGHGYGHGVGMGQWGAEGDALQGYAYQQILAAYYPGTTLGSVSTADTAIRVLLASGRKTLTVSSEQPVTVTDADGAVHTLPAGSTVLSPSLQLAVDGGPPQPLSPPLTFSPAAGSTLTLGRPYRGQLVVDVVDGRLRAIDVVPLEQYLYGVVAAEEPSSWLPAALEAQAVAARSYALASLHPAAPFDVYADGRSQAYAGASAETPAARQAVDLTAGQVLLYDGRVATTVFSASSGGRTQSAADAWGGPGEPYLVSVPDPGDVISPYHDWGPLAVTGRALGRALGVSGRVVDVTVRRNPSHRVATLTVVAVRRGQTTRTAIPGRTAASALGLRSAWFGVAVLSLSPPLPAHAVRAGTPVTLSGVVRGLRGVVLQ